MSRREVRLLSTYMCSLHRTAAIKRSRWNDTRLMERHTHSGWETWCASCLDRNLNYYYGSLSVSFRQRHAQAWLIYNTWEQSALFQISDNAGKVLVAVHLRKPPAKNRNTQFLMNRLITLSCPSRLIRTADCQTTLCSFFGYWLTPLSARAPDYGK